MATEPAPSWHLYVLRSHDGRHSYVGVALDPEARLLQHNGELPGGARRTRSGRPWSLAAVAGPFSGRGEAQQAELRVKRGRGLAERLRCAAEEPL